MDNSSTTMINVITTTNNIFLLFPIISSLKDLRDMIQALSTGSNIKSKKLNNYL